MNLKHRRHRQLQIEPSLCLTSPRAAVGCALIGIILWSQPLWASDWRVCSTDSQEAACEYQGYPGIQRAVDAAASGDRIILGPGVYTPESFRDVSYEHLVIRGGVLIEGKSLELRGEAGAILDGSKGPEVSALLVHAGAAQISGLEIRNFRPALAEDDIYEGHGIFVIDSDVLVSQTTLKHIQKMSVSIFGKSRVTVSQVQFLDGHVGIWAEGNTVLKVENSIFRNNDSAGVAAYDHTSSEIFNSIFDSNQDDGVFAKESATIVLRNSILVGNKPYAVNATEQSTIRVDYCIFDQNEAAFSPASEGAQLILGEQNFHENPGVDTDYRPGSAFKPSRGDPAILNHDGMRSDIGLFGGPAAPEL